MGAPTTDRIATHAVAAGVGFAHRGGAALYWDRVVRLGHGYGHHRNGRSHVAEDHSGCRNPHRRGLGDRLSDPGGAAGGCALHWLSTWHLQRPALRSGDGPVLRGATHGTHDRGLATLLVGSRYLGESTAVGIDWVRGVGTVLGLITAVGVPFLLFTQLEVRHDGAFGGWLMPIVPPMVSAATGRCWSPHPGGAMARDDALWVLRHVRDEPGHLTDRDNTDLEPAGALRIIGSARVPTCGSCSDRWGSRSRQQAPSVPRPPSRVAAPIAAALNLFAILYGVPMWGFMLLWMPIAALLTIRAIRKKMGFALTWWSFTFPVGTCVTGTSQLAKHTGLDLFAWAAVVLYLALLIAWVTVAVRTAHGSVRGRLLTPPPASPAVASKG